MNKILVNEQVDDGAKLLMDRMKDRLLQSITPDTDGLIRWFLFILREERMKILDEFTKYSIEQANAVCK